MSLEEPASARLFDAFASVSDPRSAHARHRLCAMCVMARGAVISGAAGWEAMEASGPAQAQWCQPFCAWPHGIPSHATGRRVRSRLKPDALTQGCGPWPEALGESRDGAIVARDGKTLWRSCEHAASQGAIHLGSAWAKAHRRV